MLKNSGRKDAPILIKAEVPGKVVLRGNRGGVGLPFVGKAPDIGAFEFGRKVVVRKKVK